MADRAGDVRAAAERLREHRRVCLVMRHPRESPYTHLEVSTGAAELIPGAEQKDLLTLANAYLAEHPADDAEPWTLKRLVEAGFWWRAGDLVSPPEHAPGTPWRLVLEQACFLPPKGRVWMISFPGCTAGLGYDLPTWGAVRKLCAVLNIPLKE